MRQPTLFRRRCARHEAETTRLASTTGAVTDSYTYDVFGAPRTVTGTTANDFRFTGQQDDVNANRGSYYLRARAYDPTLGRFLSQDPVPFAQRYAYVGNNPANWLDPSGLCPWGVPKSVCRAASAATDITVDAVITVAANPYVQQCAAWGFTGAIATGTVAGAAAGCATGVISTAFSRHVSDDPFSQCLIWAGGAVAGGGGTIGGAGGCLGGSLSWFVDGSPGMQCRSWGVTGFAFGGGPGWQRLAAGVAACFAGALGGSSDSGHPKLSEGSHPKE